MASMVEVQAARDQAAEIGTCLLDAMVRRGTICQRDVLMLLERLDATSDLVAGTDERGWTGTSAG